MRHPLAESCRLHTESSSSGGTLLKSLLITCCVMLANWGYEARGVGCDLNCAAPADCTDSSCPVCVGSCVACADLGTQTDCEDTATGASTSCTWSGGACAAGGVPELPYGLKVLFMLLVPIIIVFLFRKKIRHTHRLLSTVGIIVVAYSTNLSGTTSDSDTTQHLLQELEKVETQFRQVRHLVDETLTVSPGMCSGRLTLVTATPILTSDVISSGIYFTPYKGSSISLWDGTKWVFRLFSEAYADVGALTIDKNYDVFAYDNSGTLTLELSSAWTNDTTRADALTTRNGIYVKNSAHTRRYLGTIHTYDSSGMTYTADTSSQRFVWNYYNRVPRRIYLVDSSSPWTTTSTDWGNLNGIAANQVAYVAGISDYRIHSVLMASGKSLVAANHFATGIGIDGITNNAITYGNKYGIDLIGGMWGVFFGSPSTALGYHYLRMLQNQDNGTDGTTFYGSQANGVSGLIGVLDD